MSRTRSYVPLLCLAALPAACGKRPEPSPPPVDSILAIENERKSRSEEDWARIREAAEKGDAGSQCEIGIRLHRRLNDHESLAEGVEWFRRAARQGHAEAMYRFGHAHYSGFGIGRSAEKDYRKAVRWFARAAEKGHAPAMVMAGKCHASGGHGLVQDPALAREWFDRAAEHDDPPALHMLGDVYGRGRGVGRDRPRSFGFYMRAAKLGHRDSQYIVGQALEGGLGVERDAAGAIGWYRRAAAQGDDDSRIRLGWCHENGVGVEKDIDKALKWYGKVAEQELVAPEIARLEAERDGRAYSPPSWEAEFPVTDDIELTLVPEKAEYEIGEPAEIAVVYRNVGKTAYAKEEGDGGGFGSGFVVRDSEGRVLEDPYRPLANLGGCWASTTHTLEHGDKLTQWATLNEGVRFERPGTYSITMRGFVRSLPAHGGDKNLRRTKAAAISLRIRDFDRGKRARDIEALVSAYMSKGRLPEGLPFEKQLHHVSSEFRNSPLNEPQRYRIPRLLAFFNDPTLIPFFLDVLEDKDVNSYALCGLCGMADRARVLRAFEERLDHPEEHNIGKLRQGFFRLAAPDDFTIHPRPERSKDLEELWSMYEDKALGLLKGDREHRYAYLVPGLLGGSEDLFLVDYLLRSKPDRKLLSSCTRAVGKVKLGREHIPYLESLLDIRRDWSIIDAAITQLVRLDREKYLQVLLEDREADERRFSPEVHRLLAPDPEEE